MLSQPERSTLSVAYGLILFASILAGVFVLAVIWEFAFEEPIVGAFGGNIPQETTDQHWRYVFTVVGFTIIALIIPTWVMVRKIIQQKEVEEILQNQKNLLTSLIDSLPTPIFYKDENFIYRGCNKAFADFIGRSRSEIIGKSVYEIAPPDLADIYLEADKKLALENKPQTYEAKVQYANGVDHDVIFHKASFTKSNGSFGGIVGAMLDISDRKKSEEEIIHLASHDGLTGLPNRRLLMDRLDQALARSHRSKDTVAVLFLDLDNFKPINDTMGHRQGDDVLKMMAERLQGCLRETDTVARFGGDEFVVVMTDIKDNKDVTTLAENLNQALSEPFAIGGREAALSASIGIALYPDHAHVSESLLTLADDAMYQAKKKGKGNHCFASPIKTLTPNE